MFKMLLSTTAALSLAATGATNLTYNLVQKTNDQSFEEFLRENIIKNKIYLGKQGFIEYNNQKFTSENAFKNYLFSNSMIESKLTSSNPYKIIQDSSHMTLDPNKIYDLDIGNFKQVYRDAYGNVAETSKNALNTYANENFVKEKYSYDGIYWFESPEEAKANQKKNLKIHKSLYYQDNGRFYNAFNPEDVQKFLDECFKKGYYINIEKDLSGELLKTPIQMSGLLASAVGQPDIINGKLKDTLKKDFLENYFPKVSEITMKSSLIVSAIGDNEIRIDWSDNKGQTHYKNFPFLFPTTFDTPEGILNYFKGAGWTKHLEREKGSPEAGRIYLKRNMELINPSTGTKQTAIVELVPPYCHYWWTDPYVASFDDYVYEDTSTGVLNTYLDETKTEKVYQSPELDTPYDMQKIMNEIDDAAFNPWFQTYSSKKLKAFGANEGLDFSYEKLKNGIFIDNIEKNVYKDLFYDWTYNDEYGHSVIESYFEFQQEKQNILKNPILGEDGITRYKMWENFEATKEQLDNFLPLYGNKFSPVLRFSVGDTEDQISNDGSLLAQTYQEAQEKAFINQNPSLKKKYVIFDVFRKNQAEGSTIEEVLNSIHNKIKLDSKLVNKREIETWNWDKPIDYSDIISDGKYIVYRLKDKDNDYIYFPTEELAVSAALESAKTNGKVNNTYQDKYLFTYFDSKTLKQYSVIFYDDDIDSAVLGIMNQLNNE